MSREALEKSYIEKLLKMLKKLPLQRGKHYSE